MRKAPSVIISALLVFSMLFVFIFMFGDEDDINNAIGKFIATEQLNTQTTFSQERVQVPKKDNDTLLGNVDTSGSPDDPAIAGIPTAPNGSWLSVVSSCKELMAAKIGYYKLTKTGNYETIEDWNGNQVTLRTDCSGYVSFCLYTYGLLGSPSGITSGTGSGGGSISGVQCVDKWSGLIPGDILFYDGHVEILAEEIPAGTDPGTFAVYNYGSNSSASNPGITTTGKTFNDSNPILNVWRIAQ